MKVVHLCLASFFPDGYSYQENLLPKFHKQMGYDVEVIASLVTFDENGKITFYSSAKQYRNEYDISVTRLNYKEPTKIWRKLRRYEGFAEALEKSSPDILFIHGCQFMDIDIVAKYAKNNPKLQIFVDNHADFSNSAKNFMSKNILHKVVWKSCAHKILPYTTKFYGVLPARVDFLKNVYGLPADKCELLVMGADDEAVVAADTEESQKEIREKYGIAQDDFLVMYGGKTDNYKKQTMLLMDAVNQIDDPKLKLIVFGSVIPELKEEIEKRCSDRVQYIGWVLAADSYKYYAACDLAAFPGRHSVFWEQVAGQGKPLLVKRWDGTTHVDLGGNVKFLTQDSTEEIKTALEEILSGDTYEKMLTSAKKVSSEFLYSDIAKRSISAKK